MEDKVNIKYERVFRSRIGLPTDDIDNSTELIDPVWDLRTNVLHTPLSQPLKSYPVAGVPGAFLVPGVLTRLECKIMVAVTEHIGFFTREFGSVDVLSPELKDHNVCLLFASKALVAELSARLAPFVPRWGARGSERHRPDFINASFRCYRYRTCGEAGDAERPQYFGPHHDCTESASTVIDNVLVEDCYGAACRSQMSVLLYLNEGFLGGHTVFFPSGNTDDTESFVSVAPEMGAALCFWHGDHLLSPLHAGAALRPGNSPKYVIRTEVLFDDDEI